MAYLLKPKAKSLAVSIPFDKELKNHIAIVEQRELQTIKEKLSRQQQKEQRVNAIQKQFVEWADKKQNKIKQKIQKSSKLKEDHLNKIVKKCQQHQKYLGQKLKQFKTKNKSNLKEAWKKVQEYNKYNQNKESYDSTSKPISQNRSSPKLKIPNDVTESRILIDGYKKQPDRQYLITSYNNASKYLGNSSKEYLKELNQSIKQLKNYNLTTIQKQDHQQLKEVQMSNKLKQTLARFKNFVHQNQQQKIQQLGKRLVKIQKSRMRKNQLNSKKKHHNRTLLDTQDDRKRQQQSKNRTERLHSQSFVRQKRVNDWSQANKQKRDEIFQIHLQSGTEYLQERKLKYMKTSLSKKVALSAVQKKLYFQRLNH